MVAIEQVQVSGMEDWGSHLNQSLAEKRYSWIQGAISEDDARFLSGLLSCIKPRSIVEIGVASGWSSTVILNTLSQLNGQRGHKDPWLTGVDLSADYYVDKSIRTGAAVEQIVPELMPHYRLLTGRYSFQAMPEVGKVDFAFIDAHHAHPWAALDLIAVLPFLKPGAWVALHDINLCTFPRHEHRNRAPFYLYYLWKGAKVHSSPKIPMIGAIKLPETPLDCFEDILEVLVTPWELAIPEKHLELWVDFVRRYCGAERAETFRTCCLSANLKSA